MSPYLFGKNIKPKEKKDRIEEEIFPQFLSPSLSLSFSTPSHATTYKYVNDLKSNYLLLSKRKGTFLLYSSIFYIFYILIQEHYILSHNK